jgi:sulfite exporter TauE/SafE
VIKIIASSFVLGLALGSGPCLAGCGPLFLTYVAGSGKGVSKSIKAYLLFSASRIFVYLALGLLFFVFGRLVFAKLGYFLKFILSGAGFFVILLGVLMALGKEVNYAGCAFLRKHIFEKDIKSIILLGLFAGLLPCAPLITMLTFTGLAAKSALNNLLYSFSFGLGTAVSPLIILAALTGLLPNFLNKVKAKYIMVFNLICGLIMVALGIQLIWRAF